MNKEFWKKAVIIAALSALFAFIFGFMGMGAIEYILYSRKNNVMELADTIDVIDVDSSYAATNASTVVRQNSMNGDTVLFPFRLQPVLSKLNSHSKEEIHGWCGPMELTNSLKKEIEKFANTDPSWILVKIIDWEMLDHLPEYDFGRLLAHQYRFRKSDIDAIRNYMYANTNFYNCYYARYKEEHNTVPLKRKSK